MVSPRLGFRICANDLTKIDRLVSIGEFKGRSDFLKRAVTKMIDTYQEKLAQKTVYTIGYEGRRLDQFIETLKENDIRRLVDVREIPLSRKKGFSKTALSIALESEGIHYVHIQELGSPKGIRDRYKQSKDISWFMKEYRNYLNTLNGPFTRAKQLADQDGTCLMCFERDFSLCHRSVVAEKIREETGNRPIHL